VYREANETHSESNFKMRVCTVIALFLAVVCVATLTLGSGVELSNMHDEMPHMSESVFDAIQNEEHDLNAHDEEALFFLELSQHVENAAELEAEAEHELEQQEAAEAEGETETEVETEGESEQETETESETETEEEPALVESDSITEINSDAAADAVVAAHAESEMDAEAADALENTVEMEGDADADHNPHATFAPKIVGQAKLEQHASAVAQMKNLFDQVDHDMPSKVIMEESPYLTHVY